MTGSGGVTAVVLCGGASSRFGSDKTRARLGDATVLDHLLDALPRDWAVVCVGPQRPTRRAGLAWVREEPPGGGPVAGIAAALPLLDTAVTVLVAGDMPYAGRPAAALARHLGEHPAHGAVAAADADGRLQPLLAAFRTEALRSAVPARPAGTPARQLLDAATAFGIRVPTDASTDVDTPPDLERARHRLGGMKAVTIPEPGDADALVVADVPTPEPRAGEVRIQVAAAGVNRADVMQRKGFYPPPPGGSDYPGLEVSGTVDALGPGVDAWSVGDEVCALLVGGGYAEAVCVPAAQVLPVPRGVSLEDAAGLPEVVCTVWSNVFMTANLLPGQTLLVHGGSSGIGTMAIQLAREVGARVAVTAGSAEKLQACLELGAEILVNYREQDFVEEVRRATDGAGADVILDVVGAKYLARNVEALAVNGRLVVIGLQGGTTAELDLNTLLRKRAAVIATSLRARPEAEKATIVAAVREHVWPLLEDGRVRPVIQSRHPLADAGAAHRELEASGHVGKILLLP